MLIHQKLKQKKMFSQVQEGASFLFEYFFESYRPPDHISEEDYMKKLREDYMKKLREEYLKLKREEARRLLGLDNK